MDLILLVQKIHVSNLEAQHKFRTNRIRSMMNFPILLVQNWFYWFLVIIQISVCKLTLLSECKPYTKILKFLTKQKVKEQASGQCHIVYELLMSSIMDIPFTISKHPIIIWCKIFPFLAKKKKKWKCGEDFGWPNIRPLILFWRLFSHLMSKDCFIINIDNQKINVCHLLSCHRWLQLNHNANYNNHKVDSIDSIGTIYYSLATTILLIQDSWNTNCSQALHFI